MKYIVDRIEENIVILENQNTKEMVEVEKNLLPKEIKDGSVLNYDNETYSLDLDSELLRRKSILERFNKLRKE